MSYLFCYYYIIILWINNILHYYYILYILINFYSSYLLQICNPMQRHLVTRIHTDVYIAIRYLDNYLLKIVIKITFAIYIQRIFIKNRINCSHAFRVAVILIIKIIFIDILNLTAAKFIPVQIVTKYIIPLRLFLNIIGCQVVKNLFEIIYVLKNELRKIEANNY